MDREFRLWSNVKIQLTTICCDEIVVSSPSHGSIKLDHFSITYLGVFLTGMQLGIFQKCTYREESSLQACQ